MEQAIKVGTKVRIMRQVDWDGWVDEMTAFIGKIFTISALMEDGADFAFDGIYCASVEEVKYVFPISCMEILDGPVEDESSLIKVGDGAMELFDPDKYTEDKAQPYTVYIAGPMTGKLDANGEPNWNRPLFFAVEGDLNGPHMGWVFKRAAGLSEDELINIINPAGLDAEDPNTDLDDLGATPWEYYLQRDIRHALDVDAVLLIDDWWNSAGAVLEAFIAFNLKKPIFQLNKDGSIVPAEDKLPVTFEAHSIVLGARRFTYGHPKENFEKIRDRWNVTLADKLSAPLTITDVAFLMIDVKMAREQNAAKKDNLTDVVGYASALHEALRQQEWEVSSLPEQPEHTDTTACGCEQCQCQQ
jgi:hypothetical protein